MHQASLLDDSTPRPDSPTDSAHSAHVSDRSTSDEQTIPLRSVNAVTAYLPTIDAARTQVTAEMENMVVSGLATMVGRLTIILSQTYLFHVIRTSLYWLLLFKRRLTFANYPSLFKISWPT